MQDEIENRELGHSLIGGLRSLLDILLLLADINIIGFSTAFIQVSTAIYIHNSRILGNTFLNIQLTIDKSY